MSDTYKWINGWEVEGMDDCYEELQRPNGETLTVLTEPEDRKSYRDLSPITDELNRLYKILIDAGIDPNSEESGAIKEVNSDVPCSRLYSVGEKVRHKASGKIGVVRRIRLGPCVNPTHTNPFACCTMTSVFDPNPCQYNPIDVYDISMDFGEDIFGVEGFLISANKDLDGCEEFRISEGITELKPCPFCGSKAELLNKDEKFDVRCLNLECYLCDGADWFYPKNMVVEMWNKRFNEKLSGTEERGAML